MQGKLNETEDIKCCMCGKLASEDSHFNKKRKLCNRHYIQLRVHGKYLDNECVYNPDRNDWSSEEDIKLENLYSQQIKICDIASELGRTKSECTARASHLGLPDKYMRPNNCKFKAIYQDYNWCYEHYIVKRMSLQEMADEAGCSLRVIQKWCVEKHKLNAHTLRHFLKLTELQKQLIIVGTLGDGHIDRRKTQPMYIESHAEDQKEYLFWKYEILKNLCNKKPVYYNAKVKVFNNINYTCQGYYRLNTKIIDELDEIRAMGKLDKIKNLSKWQFCILLLDDGNRDSLWHFCCATWTSEEKEIFLTKCEKEFKLRGWINKDIRYITFDANSSFKIDEYIKQNIPNNLDIIKNKITNNPRIRKYRRSFYIITTDNKIGLATYCKRHHIKFERARDVVWNIGLDFPEMKEQDFILLMKSEGINYDI